MTNNMNNCCSRWLMVHYRMGWGGKLPINYLILGSYMSILIWKLIIYELCHPNIISWPNIPLSHNYPDTKPTSPFPILIMLNGTSINLISQLFDSTENQTADLPHCEDRAPPIRALICDICDIFWYINTCIYGSVYILHLYYIY